MIKLVKGDITTFQGGAIVNAANGELRSGGGVCGAIYKAAGPELEAYTNSLDECPTGSAVITPSFKLGEKKIDGPRYIIHAVGPDIRTEHDSTGAPTPYASKRLRACYINSLMLAIRHGITEVAFPSISTGIYGYPIEDACEVAVAAVSQMIAQRWNLTVTFYVFSEADYLIYEDELSRCNLPG